MKKETDITIKTYAPVVIPTLCRFNHFKKCIESLARCKWANRTDVFVGVDYPAKEAHWDGYKKICDYLAQVKLNFKSLNILIRNQNMGVGKNGNLATLEKEVLEKYDRFIGSEDDNIFSPNFLVFMNKGLEKFKDDKNVLAINGYRHFYPIKRASNSFIRQNVDFSGWGYGFWKDRMEKMKILKNDYFQKRFSLKLFWKVYKENGSNRALNFASYAFAWNGIMSDSPISVYAKLEDLNVIMPAEESLVRNIGWDDSGEHHLNNDSLAQQHLEQKISDNEDFDFVGTGFEYYKDNRKIFRNNSYAKISTPCFAKCCVKILIKYLSMKLGFLKK